MRMGTCTRGAKPKAFIVFMDAAAARSQCTTCGPHAFNFRQTMDALLADNGAILVNDERELFQKMRKCLLEPDFAREIAASGREVIKKNQGATDRSIEQIAKLLRATS